MYLPRCLLPLRTRLLGTHCRSLSGVPIPPRSLSSSTSPSQSLFPLSPSSPSSPFSSFSCFSSSSSTTTTAFPPSLLHPSPPSNASIVTGSSSPPLLSLTISQLLQHTTSLHGDRPALVVSHQHVRWSYAELAHHVQRLATGLLLAGLKPGEAIGICSSNNTEWILLQYAAAYAGLVLVNINPAYRARELSHALNTVGVKALAVCSSFRSNDFIAMLNEIIPELHSLPRGETGTICSQSIPSLRSLFLIPSPPSPSSSHSLSSSSPHHHSFLSPPPPSSLPHGFLSFASLLQTNIDGGVLQGVGDITKVSDVANVQFTSGTTGLPKGAALTHRNIVNNGFMVGWTLRYSPLDRVCLCVPMYHCFGMVMASLAAVAHGACIVMPSDWFDAGAVLAAIEREKCTSLNGVPTMFIAELEHPSFPSTNLSSLRTGIMAGSICPAELMRKVIDVMGVREMTVCYGMTETSPVSFQSHIDDAFEVRVGTVGRIHPHVQSCIVNPETQKIVERGEAGELLTRGYSVMKEYWGRGDKTREAIDGEGWMHTGDMATIDEHGYCRIVGRYKDMVIRGGENVYPSEVEEVLYTHPHISDVQVVGVPDPKYGEELAACIISHSGKPVPSAKEIQAFCKNKMAAYKVPRYVVPFSVYPMTVTGKVQKYLLREHCARVLGLS